MVLSFHKEFNKDLLLLEHVRLDQHESCASEMRRASGEKNFSAYPQSEGAAIYHELATVYRQSSSDNSFTTNE